MSTTADTKSGNSLHWRIFVAAILLVMGGQGFIFNGIGNYITPLMSVTGQGQAAIAGALSVGSLAMMVELAFVGKIMKKVPLKPLLIVTSIIACAGFMSLAFATTIVAVYIGFIVMCLGCAIPFYVAGPTLITNWFEKKRGMLMGIVMMFGNIGAIVSSLLAGQLLGPVEPYNMSTFLVIGGISFACLIIGSLLAIMHPAMKGLKAYGAEESAQAAGDKVDPESLPGVTAGMALKSAAFFCVFLAVFFLVVAGSFSTLLSNFINVGFGYSNADGAILIAVFNVGAAVGAFLWGALDDKLGVIPTCIIGLICIIVGLLGMVLLGGTGFAMVLVFGVIFGLGTSTAGVQQPMLASSLFGQRDFASILSKIQMGQSIGGLVGALIIGIIVQITGSYTPGVILLVVLMVICIFLLLAARGSAKKLWEKAGQVFTSK